MTEQKKRRGRPKKVKVTFSDVSQSTVQVAMQEINRTLGGTHITIPELTKAVKRSAGDFNKLVNIVNNSYAIIMANPGAKVTNILKKYFIDKPIAEIKGNASADQALKDFGFKELPNAVGPVKDKAEEIAEGAGKKATDRERMAAKKIKEIKDYMRDAVNNTQLTDLKDMAKNVFSSLEQIIDDACYDKGFENTLNGLKRWRRNYKDNLYAMVRFFYQKEEGVEVKGVHAFKGKQGRMNFERDKRDLITALGTKNLYEDQGYEKFIATREWEEF